VFGSGFDEDDRNRLKEAAKQEAYNLAKDLVQKLRSDVQQSARQTMEALARGFDTELARIAFKDSDPEQTDVVYAQPAATAP
jgi:SOS response regulatory protein OraA/RecX